MCGRYTLRARPKTLAEHFGLDEVPPLGQRYNIAPSQDVPVVRPDLERPGRELSLLQWGLIPSWAADPTIGSKMTNARAETVADKPAYRSAFRHRRCLVPADGFFEFIWTIPSCPYPERASVVSVRRAQNDSKLNGGLVGRDGC